MGSHSERGNIRTSGSLDKAAPLGPALLPRNGRNTKQRRWLDRHGYSDSVTAGSSWLWQYNVLITTFHPLL